MNGMEVLLVSLLIFQTQAVTLLVLGQAALGSPVVVESLRLDDSQPCILTEREKLTWSSCGSSGKAWRCEAGCG